MHGPPSIHGVRLAALPAGTPLPAHRAAVIGRHLLPAAVTHIAALRPLLPAAAAVTIIIRRLLPAAVTGLQAAHPAAGSKSLSNIISALFKARPARLRLVSFKN